jgi:hypothetical protein
MENNELETTLEKLEQEVLDEIENPYRPYRVEFPYGVRFTIPNDGHNTEITIRTRSEEVRFGRNEQDILLQKEVDNRYGKDTYAKHIIEYAGNHIRWGKGENLKLEYIDAPSVTPMTEKDAQEFIRECLNDDE